jgi:ketosteroid isomerase-like protein
MLDFSKGQLLSWFRETRLLNRGGKNPLCLFATDPVVSACHFRKGGDLPMKPIVCWALMVMLGATLAPVPAVAGDKSDLAARAATWEKEYNAGNLPAVQALYAADGCRMPPNQAAARGSEAILAQLQAGKDRGFAKVKIAVTAAETSGDLGYGMGTYEVTGSDGSHVDHGKWMLIEKKSNGTWKTECDIFNSDMPMAGAGMK